MQKHSAPAGCMSTWSVQRMCWENLSDHDDNCTSPWHLPFHFLCMPEGGFWSAKSPREKLTVLLVCKNGHGDSVQVLHHGRLMIYFVCVCVPNTSVT